MFIVTFLALEMFGFLISSFYPVFSKFQLLEAEINVFDKSKKKLLSFFSMSLCVGVISEWENALNYKQQTNFNVNMSEIFKLYSLSLTVLNKNGGIQHLDGKRSGKHEFRVTT